VGERIKIAYSRAVVRGAMSGALADVPYVTDPIFGFEVPQRCPDVPDDVLNPRATWADADAYDVQVRKLAGLFAENFESFADRATEEVVAAGPKID
jgi:phosphoenolpyruvate carboxykinase (ATP)